MASAPDAVPNGAEDITAEWLSRAIGGGTVTSVGVTPVGTGQIADSLRVAMSWDPPGAGPGSVVVKVTSSAEASRNAAAATRTYEVEVGFYRDLAPGLPVHAPRCYWAGHDPATNAYAVVLEDMAPARQGDQIAGCSVDEAALALDEAALLHGARWGDAGLARLAWLSGGLGASPGIALFVQSMIPGFLERYEHRLERDVVELVLRYTNALAAAPAYDGPQTVVHNDFRNDNLLFGGQRVCVLDWQTVSLGAGMLDVAYFLGGSLLPHDRRTAERDLLDRYRSRLRSQGVDLPRDDCWEQYRRNAFAGLTMAIIASSLVVRTERGDDMFVAMAERAALHALDVDAEKALVAAGSA